jgi:hypothetical protein
VGPPVGGPVGAIEMDGVIVGPSVGEIVFGATVGESVFGAFVGKLDGTIGGTPTGASVAATGMPVGEEVTTPGDSVGNEVVGTTWASTKLPNKSRTTATCTCNRRPIRLILPPFRRARTVALCLCIVRGDLRVLGRIFT